MLGGFKMSSAIHQSPPANVFESLIRQMESLRADIVQQACPGQEALKGIPADRLASAENLLHYLVLRSTDIRPLQDRLTQLGLSSLGRTEPHVLATINAVLHNLYLVSGQEHKLDDADKVYTAFDAGAHLLEQNTISLFGDHPEKRRAHIIVTMPVEAADDNLMVHQLLKSGMNCMRINCAHDYPEIWSRMINTLRNAERSTGLSCKILMDLGGPKLRLGPMETYPAVVKVRPVRGANGRIRRPARIWLTSAKTGFSEVAAADASFTVGPEWLAKVAKGDRLRFRDVRGSRRNWRIR